MATKWLWIYVNLYYSLLLSGLPLPHNIPIKYSQDTYKGEHMDYYAYRAKNGMVDSNEYYR
jgi:hypothetical protein